MAFAPAAHADPQADWLKARQAEFATWQAAHPDVEAQVADLKAKTAVLVEAYRNRPRPAPYAVLVARSAAASPADKQAAVQAFHAGFTLWQSGDFASAEAAFKQGLDLDPTNGMANFYYGDCLQRRGDNADAGEYMARAVFFGGQSTEAFKARTALASLPAPPAPDAALPPVILRTPGAITELWDGPDTPKMVVIPAGEYTMGSPASEPDRYDNKGPQHRVTIGYALAVGKYDITRSEFAAFAAATGYKAQDNQGCIDSSNWSQNARGNWQRPGFDQTGADPVVCISFIDAGAYAAWLSQKTGHAYRLLSEAEYEYAVRVGSTTAFWWGDDRATACSYENGADLVNNCHDGFVFTSPAGSFRANAFGLYDMAGDAGLWTEDCYSNYRGTPVDGSASAAGDCGRRVDRGGSWFNTVRSDYRDDTPLVGARINSLGFRVARTL
jgi:formylglycine-generating enzyme required for sulfatase activity